MRILVLLTSLNTGGAEYSTLAFYGWLKQQGYEIKIACCKIASSQFDVQGFGLNDVVILDGKGFMGKWKALRSLIRIFQPEIMHSVLFEANMLGRCCRFLNRKFVHLESLVNQMYAEERLLEPGISYIKLKGYQLLDKVTQRIGVDHYHANGESVALHYRKKLGIGVARITTIPRGRRPNAYINNRSHACAVKENVFKTNDKIILIHVGRHEFQKGHDILFTAVSMLGSERDKMHLVLVGREGNYTGHIREKIERLGLSEYISILGHRTDVYELLAAADIFVFPSRFEGLSGALIEAQASGLPVICSRIPANAEVAKENVNALFFNIEKPEELADCLSTMINNEKMRKEFGRKSLILFKQKFEIQRYFGEMRSLLDKLKRKAKGFDALLS